jgi:hypothetical protein
VAFRGFLRACGKATGSLDCSSAERMTTFVGEIWTGTLALARWSCMHPEVIFDCITRLCDHDGDAASLFAYRLS